MDGSKALMVWAMRKAAYTEPGKGTDSSTTCGLCLLRVARVRALRVSSTSVGGPARAWASGVKVGWAMASDSA